MDTQEKQNMPKSTKVCIFIIVVLFISTICIAYFGSEYAYNNGYKAGYSAGKDAGYGVGYTKGHAEGYADAENDYNSSNDGGYLGPYTGEYDYDDTEYSVFVTPSGEKYHRNGCQYISGKYNLKIYASADEAANDGYEPCSVCNPY